MIAGRATPQGTARRAAGREGYRRLGRTGLTVSSVGFGGYRTGRRDPLHGEALRAALEAGVNLLDTSSNYMLGDSERLIGEVLAESALPRDEIVVVSKIGYVQGPNLELAQQREAAGQPFPEMVKYMDGCWYCISPAFLDDQLSRALDRLGLETIDVLLLHNPEYFLLDAAHHQDGRLLDQIRAEFYDRLARAFAYLDGAAANGRIGAYGVSSNSCVLPEDDPEATSVTRMVEASGGQMAVLQLPYNLFEAGALLERNTPEGTALGAALRHDLGVLVNRPLNAMARIGGRPGRLIRLADPPRPGAPGSDEILRAQVERLGEREAQLAHAAPGIVPPRVAELLLSIWEEIAYPQAFQQIFRSEIVPEAQRGLRELVAALGTLPDPAKLAEIQAYQDQLNALIEPLQARATRQDSRVAEQIRAAIQPSLPLPLWNERLSRIALGFVASTPGVSCVLNGMRHPAYVEDGVAVMTQPPIPDVESVARALAGAVSQT
ncbi:MAG: aldo/keto reductase [Chloroflexi bacterium]|nr:aldo/keto reductase [Chloroflexota bacterium]